MNSLVTQAEALGWGFSVSDVALRRASARVRGHLSQQISSGASTITARGPVFRLPQRPVVSVESITDANGAPVEYELAGSQVTTDNLGLLTVAYTHGYATLPDELAELVCQIASRLGAPNEALAQGVQTQSAGGFSVGYGWDAWKAQAGLTQGEKDTLARYWPRLPQIITAGPA